MTTDYRLNVPRWKLRQRRTKRRLILRAETEAVAIETAERLYGGQWRVKGRARG